MTTLDLIHEFEQLGVSIWREGDALKFDAPIGTMTPEKIDLLKQNKSDLLAFLSAGNASTIEPMQQRNDGLMMYQKRALDGLAWLLDNKRQNLIKGGYAPDNAKVKRQEWRDKVAKVLVLSRERMEKLESDLFRMGAIVYDTHNIFVMAGAWQAVSNVYQDNPDFILPDDTGKTFCQWHFESQTIH